MSPRFLYWSSLIGGAASTYAAWHFADMVFAFVAVAFLGIATCVVAEDLLS